MPYNLSELHLHIFIYFLFIPCHLSAKRTSSLRCIVSVRSVKLSALLRTLLTLQETRSPEQPPITPVRPKSSTIPNKIPVILSGFDSQFKSWRTVMGELRQHHPSLKVSQVKELPKGDLLIIGDSMQDMLILQNETKMKAALGKNVRISLPKPTKLIKVKTSVLR